MIFLTHTSYIGYKAWTPKPTPLIFKYRILKDITKHHWYRSTDLTTLYWTVIFWHAYDQEQQGIHACNYFCKLFQPFSFLVNKCDFPYLKYIFFSLLWKEESKWRLFVSIGTSYYPETSKYLKQTLTEMNSWPCQVIWSETWSYHGSLIFGFAKVLCKVSAVRTHNRPTTTTN